MPCIDARIYTRQHSRIRAIKLREETERPNSAMNFEPWKYTEEEKVIGNQISSETFSSIAIRKVFFFQVVTVQGLYKTIKMISILLMKTHNGSNFCFFFPI
jgi:hypothetical protein